MWKDDSVNPISTGMTLASALSKNPVEQVERIGFLLGRCTDFPTLAGMTGFMQYLQGEDGPSKPVPNPLVLKTAVETYIKFRKVFKDSPYDPNSEDITELTEYSQRYLNWANNLASNPKFFNKLLGEFTAAEKGLATQVGSPSNLELNIPATLAQFPSSGGKPQNCVFHEHGSHEGPRKNRYTPLPGQDYIDQAASYNLFPPELLLAEKRKLGKFHVDVHVCLTNGANQWRRSTTERTGLEVSFKFNDGTVFHTAKPTQRAKMGPMCDVWWQSGHHSHPSLREMVKVNMHKEPWTTANQATIRNRIAAPVLNQQKTFRDNMLGNLPNRREYHERTKAAMSILTFMRVAGASPQAHSRAKGFLGRDILGNFRKGVPTLCSLQPNEQNELRDIFNTGLNPKNNPLYFHAKNTIRNLQAFRESLKETSE